MCAEAHKYGIHVIVDVVANHLGNDGTAKTITSSAPAEIRNNSAYWHTNWNVPMDSNPTREGKINYSMTSDGSLPDLNTEYAPLQQRVLDFLKECISSGADGFRFDAAKHIGTAADGSQYTFWDNVIPAAKQFYKDNGYFDSLYCYGEVLGDSGASNNQAVINSYFSNIKLTCEYVGNDIRNAMKQGNAEGTKIVDFYKGYGTKVSSDNVVLWAESHDTYQGDGKESTGVSQDVINRTWALVAARANATALYYVRTTNWRTGNIGEVCTDYWEAPEVAAVNKFHNAMNGETEYLSVEGNISYVERGTRGAVLVNVGGGSAYVNVAANKMADGTYTEQITGNTFAVSNGKISGQIGSTGIAVIYNAETGPSLKAISTTKNFTDTLDVTLMAKNMTKAHYVTAEGDSGDFTGSKVITIGESAADDSVISILMTGEDADGKKYEEQFDFYKYDPEENNGYVPVYFDNSKLNWSEPIKAYLYSSTTNNGWPGDTLTKETGSLYRINVPSKYANGNIIFYSTDANRYPANGVPGMEILNRPRLFTEKMTLEDYVPEHEMLVNTTQLSLNSIALGQSVSVIPSSDGGYSGKKYSLVIKKDDVEQASYALGDPNNINYTPESAGQYVFESYVEDEKGLCSRIELELQVEAPSIQLTNNSQVSCTECRSGDDILIDLSAAGGTGQYTFDVKYRYDNGSWYPITLSTTDASVIFNAPKSGNLELSITANDGSNTSTITRNVTVYRTLINTSELITQIAYVNLPIEFSLSATDGKGSYTYDVFYTYENGEPVQVASDTSDESVQFTPDQGGNVSVLIIAKDGLQTKEKTLYFTVHNDVELTLDISEGPYLTGDEITFTCSASGGIGSYTYQIDYRFNDGNWIEYSYMTGNYGTDSFCFWQVGKYDFKITASDSISTDEKIFTVTVGEMLNNDSYILGQIENWYVGIDQLEIVFNASGGSGEYTYSASVSFTGETEYTETLCEKVAQNEIFFDPTEAGFYTFTVTVFDSEGNSAETSLDVEVRNLVTNTSYIDGNIQQCNLGDSLDLVISAEYGYAPYSYDVYYKYDDGDYCHYDKGNGFETIEFYANTAGTLTIKVVVRDDNYIFSGEAEKEISINVNDMFVNQSYIVGSPTVEYTSNEINIQFAALGGSGDYSYTAYLTYNNGEAVTLCEKTTDDSKAFTPNVAGTYKVTVVAYDGQGQNATVEFEIEVRDSITNKCSIEGEIYSCIVGDTLTIDLAAEGGFAPYSYTVAYYYDDISLIQNYCNNITDKTAIYFDVEIPDLQYSSSNLYFKITVKDANGMASEKIISVTVYNKLENECTIQDYNKKATVGDDIVINCSASGGKGTYNYSVYYKTEKDEKYTQYVDYDSCSEIVFSPEKYGKLWLKISVKDENGKTANIYKYFKVNPRSLENGCSVEKSVVPFGQAFTVNCSAKGGYTDENESGYQYALSYRDCSDETNTYHQVYGFGDHSTMEFTPETAGRFVLKMSVRDTHNNVKNAYATVRTGLTNTSTLTAEKVYFGETMTVNCSAVGGYPGYEFALSYKTVSQNSYTLSSDYSACETMSFTPAVQENHILKISVKDTKGTVKNIYKYFRVAPERLTNKCVVSETKKFITPNEPSAVFDVICDAQGGHGGYQYAIAVKENGTYVEKVPYSNEQTMSISFDKIGSYILKISVKDSKNTVKNIYKTVRVSKGS